MLLRRFLLGTALAVSFAVSAPTPAKADPITAAVVSFIGFTGTAAAVATFVVNSALYAAGSWALGKVASKLSGRKTSLQERQASVLTLSLGETPREAVFGTFQTGGSLIDTFNDGGEHNTDRVTRVIALADHAVDGLAGYWVDDSYVAFAGNGVQAGFNGKLEIHFVNATAAGSSPPATYLGKSTPPWTVNDKLVGVTHVWVSYSVDDEVWTQGHPQFGFVVRGLRLYDPRKDVRFGYVGSDAHVWEDPTTHEHSHNPVLQEYAYRRGVYAVGHHGEAEHLLIGRGLTETEAPPERIIAAANLCDEEVAEGRVRYAASGVVRASDDHRTVSEWFAQACAGQIVQREGGIEIAPGQAKAAVVTITDGDLIAGEPVTVAPFLPDSDGGRVNTVVPRYVEPNQRWKDTSGAVRRDLDDIADDGGPRELTLPLPFVTDAAQADRCAEIARRLARLEWRAGIVLGPEYGDLEEDDWIAWQSARHHGGATRRYRIDGWTLDAQWRFHAALREIAASAFTDGDLIDGPDGPTTPGTPGPLVLADVAVEPVDLGGGDATLPAARFTWTTPVDAGVRAIRAEVREVGTTRVAASRTEDVQAGELIVTNGVGPDMDLEGRLVPIADPSRAVTASDWLPLTSGPVVNDDHVIPGDVGTLSAPTLVRNIQADGTVQTTLNVTWTAAVDAVSYEVEITPSNGSGAYIVPAAGLSLKSYPVSTGIGYSLRVRGRSSTGDPSENWTGPVSTGTVGGDTTPPGQVTDPVVIAGPRLVHISFDLPADADYLRQRIYRNTSGTYVGASLIGFAEGSTFDDFTGAPGTAYHYWGRSEDASGNLNATYTYLGTATPRLVTGGVDTDPLDDEISNRPRFDTDNRVLQSDFDFVDGGFGVIYNSDAVPVTKTVGESAGRRYFQAAWSATAAGQLVSVGTAGEAFRFRVNPGERLSVQLRLGATGPVATVTPAIRFYTARGGSVVSTVNVAAPMTGAQAFGTLRQAFVTVPAGAYWAEIENYVESSGSGALTNAISEPMVTPASAVQTVHPPYAPGSGAIPGRMQYIDNAGRVVDGRGLPVNVSGYVLDPVVQIAPGSPPDTSIALVGGTATLQGGQTITLPSGSITGLSASTVYAVFRDLQAGAYVALASGATGYFTDASRYLRVGSQTTAADAGGTYTPPPPAPPGYLGGGGLADRYEDGGPI